MNLAPRTHEALDGRAQVDNSQNLRATARAVQALLDGQSVFIDAFTDEQYTQSLDLECGTVGAHVRHCLDHVRALLHGAARGIIDYDARRRGTDIETQREAGLHETRILRDELDSLPANNCDAPVQVRGLVAASGPTITVPSHLNRELAFVLSHTIHHHALMAVIARALAVPVPEHFGCAPATIAYWGSSECVR